MYTGTIYICDHLYVTIGQRLLSQTSKTKKWYVLKTFPENTIMFLTFNNMF